MDFVKFLKSRLATFVLGLTLVLVMVGSARIFIQKYQVDSEIKKLEKEAEKINQKNLELSELIKYLDTPEYKERQAREQLNLKKEGEFVVALPVGRADEANEPAEPQTVSNPRKWFDYFFSS
ncbi:MAG: septum formation initiator family protein [Candidatus Doudnabacteria bacterium]|nr:septum formation initiator family protein [Candidatus Doudnabacteria bacterium]